MMFKNIKFRTKMFLPTVFGTLVFIVVGAVAILGVRSMDETMGWVEHTYEVIGQANYITSLAVDMETGQRGFLLTGKDDYLAPYINAEKKISESISVLKKTVNDNPQQVARMEKIEQAIKNWQNKFATPLINLRREIGEGKDMNDIGALVREGRGKAYFDRFRSKIATFIDREEKLLEQRKKSAIDTATSKTTADAAQWIEHTYVVIQKALNMLEAAINMETGLRGYLLAGKEDFLEPYNQGKKAIFEVVTALKSTVSDNPAQVVLIGEIEQTIREWEEKDVLPSIELRRKIANSKTMLDLNVVLAKGEGKAIFDEFRQLISEFVKTEQSLMENRKKSAQGAAGWSQVAILIGIFTAILIGVLVSLYVAKGLMKQIGAEPAEMVEVGKQMAIGNLDIKWNTANPTGVYAAIKAIQEVVLGLQKELGRLTEASTKGQLSERGKSDKFQGAYGEVVVSVNKMLDAILLPIGEGNRVLRLIRGGNLREKVEIKCEGDHEQMKQAINGLHSWLTELVNYVTKIANGDMTATMNKASEQDQIHEWLMLLKTNIGTLVGDAVMLAKAAVEGKLATRADASKHQGDFRKIVQGVNDTLDAVIGPLNVAAGYVDRISKGDIPPKITDTYNGDFNTIKNNLNQCVDAVNAMMADAVMLAKAAVDGKLATRADATKHQGDFRKIVQGVNDTLDAVIGPLNVAAGYVDRISKGDIPPKITDTYNGDFNTIKTNLNQCVDAVNYLVADAAMLSKAAVDGKLATRADATKHQGDFRKIVQGVNDTLDAVIGPLNVAAGYVDRISKGDIPHKITDTYYGDFNTIKNNLNQCVDAVNYLVADAGLLSKAAVDGKLATRADATKHQGDFRKIVQGVNDTLDAVIGPLNEAAEVLSAAAERNLTKEVEGEYKGQLADLKKNINTMLWNLDQALGQVSEAVQQVAGGSNQISDSSQSLSQGATEQAASLEQITSSMTQMGSQTKANAENASQANQLATTARESAENGNTQMGEMIAAISEISTSSKEIAKIIKVIDEIAFQTNLLALNAAVEAARAGKHGKGFAVVAQEVRNLAGRSAKAAKETAELIEDSVKKVEKGTTIANRTAQALVEIVEGAKKVGDLVGEIAAASNEQAQGISQINQGLTQIEKVTQQNTANAEETASASEELSGQAAQLSQLLAQFRLRNQTGSQITGPQPGAAFQTKRLTSGPAAAGGWGGKAPRSPQIVGPEEIISLDDKDFGKY